jgi:hypothetical protein
VFPLASLFRPPEANNIGIGRRRRFMFRVRSTMLVRYGHYNDVVTNSERLNEIAADMGWKQSTFWASMSGQDNVFVVETDFENLEQYQRESDATYQDAEYMKTIRANIDYVVEGSVHTEFLQTAGHIA